MSKYLCVCSDREILSSSKKSHEKTKKHINFMNLTLEKQYNTLPKKLDGIHIRRAVQILSKCLETNTMGLFNSIVDNTYNHNYRFNYRYIIII